MPLALALTTGEETAFASLGWEYVWGECGSEGGERMGSLHVAGLVSGTALRLELPQPDELILGMIVARGELVMAPAHEHGYFTMPISPPHEIATVATPGSVRSIVQAGNAAFLLLDDGRIVRHARGEEDVLIGGLGAERLVSAFGGLYALSGGQISELEPADGSVLRVFSISCSIGQVAPSAPSHLVMACGERTIGLLDLATGTFQTQTLLADLQYVGGAEYASVALASYGAEYMADATGTLAVVPVQGLPASDVVSAYGGPFDAVTEALFLRNQVALVEADLVWRLSLSTANGAVGVTAGTYTLHSQPALPLGAERGIQLHGGSTSDDDATLSGALVEIDTYADVIHDIPLQGPPPPPHDS